MSTDAVLVVNPSAGGGRAARQLEPVAAALRASGWSVGVECTRSLAHADELAARCAADALVCVGLGGDGLLGRLGGALAGTDGVLVPLPGGRGNDFVRMLGLPRDPAAAAAVCAAGPVRRVDVGEVTSALGTRRFLGIASLGFDSVVNEAANASRGVPASMVYLVSALRAVTSWQPAQFTLTVDGEDDERTFTGWSVACANSGYYGGGMHMAPAARLDDGRLQLVTAGDSSRSRFLRSFPKVFAGTHVEAGSVDVRVVREVVVNADRPFDVYADGDPVASLPATVRVLGASLQVLAGPVP